MARKTIIGLVLRDRTLEWTSLRTRPEGGPEVAQQESLTLETGGDTFQPDAPEAVAALKTATRNLKGRHVIAVPTARALLRVVNLPATDPAELSSMVELQVDKFSPFPVEHMAVSWERLGQEGERSRVLIAAVQSEVIESAGGLFQRAGCTPHVIDVEIMGWWHLLKAGGHVVDEGRQVLVLVDTRSIELIVAQNGVPLIFRSLDNPAGDKPDDATAVAEIAEETNYTLTTLEADWGAEPRLRLNVWHWGQPPAPIVARLQEECGVEAGVSHLGTLPPLSEGLARRAAGVDARTLDLTPAAWHEAESTGLARKKLLTATAAVFVVWLAGILAFIVALQLQSSSLRSLRARVTQVEQPAEEVRQIMEKVQELEEYGDRSHSGLECLREISEVLPPGLNLARFDYKKAKEVNLRGETAPNNVNLIYQFFEDLESSELFESVENQKVSTRGSGAGLSAEFTVVAKLPSPAGTEEEQP